MAVLCHVLTNTCYVLVLVNCTTDICMDKPHMCVRVCTRHQRDA
jgi:hypothetical protein